MNKNENSTIMMTDRIERLNTMIQMQLSTLNMGYVRGIMSTELSNE